MKPINKTLCITLLILCARTALAGETPRVSPARTAAAADLVDIHRYAPAIAEDIKYAGDDNFLGRPADGYAAAKCLLHPSAAAALARVERTLRGQGYALRLWDCYRPTRAVADFMRWAQDANDTRTRAKHYPHVKKSQLFAEGYIAATSTHSRGATVDLTLMRCTPTPSHCTPLDMGTDFDYFDPRAHTETPGLSNIQRSNRARLRTAMAQAGFQNYPLEWWHYTLQPEPTPNTAYNVPIR